MSGIEWKRFSDFGIGREEEFEYEFQEVDEVKRNCVKFGCNEWFDVARVFAKDRRLVCKNHAAYGFWLLEEQNK